MGATSEDVLAGWPEADDRVVIERLAAFGAAPVPGAVAAEHLGAIGRHRAGRRRRRRAALAGVAGAGLLLGSTSLAAAGVLPAPAQTAMHHTLEHIGIDVPAARRGDAARPPAVPRPTGPTDGATPPPDRAARAEDAGRRDAALARSRPAERADTSGGRRDEGDPAPRPAPAPAARTTPQDPPGTPPPPQGSRSTEDPAPPPSGAAGGGTVPSPSATAPGSDGADGADGVDGSDGADAPARSEPSWTGIDGAGA